MKRCYALLVFALALMVSAHAQTLSEKVSQHENGEGTIFIFQDPELKALLDGTEYPPRIIKPQKPVVKKDTIRIEHHEEKPVQKHSGENTVIKIKQGYRIQIFAGSNSRQSREKAYAAGRMFRGNYIDIPVYVHFISPHWTCSVGNFTDLGEARKFLAQLKSKGRFGSANVVKTRIIVRE